MALSIAVLPIGQIDPTILHYIEDGLVKIFPEASCFTVNDLIDVPKAAYDKNRKQHRSNHILGLVQSYATRVQKTNRVLGIVDVDIFVPELNFVFGEAIFHGKAALVSLWRLNPKFYGAKVDVDLYTQRSLKEAVHEVGHTLGLNHCPRSSCVMHFSNSIFDTDKKQNLFCDECYLKATLSIGGLERHNE